MILRRVTALAVLTLLAGAAGEPAPAAGDVVAQRGTDRITASELRDLVDRLDPQARAQLATPGALANFVRDRLLQAGLTADAHAKNWDQRPDVVKLLNDVRDAALAQNFLQAQTAAEPGYPTDADINAAYEANKAKFVLPKQYNLLQILVPVPAGAPAAADEEARRKAADLRAQALKRGSDFAELAKKNTPDGGVVGLVREDQMVPGVKAAVVALPDGGITEPLRTPAGWHVVKLIGTKPAGTAPLASLRDQLVQALRQAQQQQLARAYVDDMLKRQPIQLNEIDLARAIAPR